MALDTPNRPGAAAEGGLTQRRRWLRFGSNVAVAILLATALAVIALWMSAMLLPGRARSDWTATGRFSLSPRSRAMLDDLGPEVRITNLYSHTPEIPASEEQWQRVQDLLNEYDAASRRVTVEAVNPAVDAGGVEKLVARLKQRYARELRKPGRLVDEFNALQKDIRDLLEREGQQVEAAAAAWKGGPARAVETLLMVAQVWRQLLLIGDVTASGVESLSDQPLPAYSSALTQATTYLKQVRERFEAVPEAFQQLMELAKDASPPEAVTKLLGAAQDTYPPLAERIKAFEEKAKVDETELDEVRRDIDRGETLLVETFAEKGVVRTPATDEAAVKAAALKAGAEKVQEPLEEGAQGLEVIAPPDKLEAVRKALEEAKMEVASSAVETRPDRIKVVAFEDIWVRNPDPEPSPDAPSRLFDGESAISSALLGMCFKEKPALLFVTSGAPATTGMPMMGPMGGGGRGPYMDMAERLRKANFIVEDWNVLAEPEVPSPENASKVILVLIPPPQPSRQMMMPPPDPEQYRPAVEAIRQGAPAIVMGEPATMFQSPVPYADLYKEFGTDAKFSAVAVRNVVVDAAGTERAYPQVEVTRYEAHEITRPLGALPTMFLRASPLVLLDPLPEGVTAHVLANLPAGRDYWADTVVFEALQNQAKRDDAEDIAGPVPLAVAVERKVGDAVQKVVLFGDAELAQDGVAFYRDVFGRDLFPGNAELFVNACLWVSGKDHLITVSPEALQARRIGDPGAWQLPLQIFIIVGLPALVLVAGIVVYVIRRG